MLDGAIGLTEGRSCICSLASSLRRRASLLKFVRVVTDLHPPLQRPGSALYPSLKGHEKKSYHRETSQSFVSLSGWRQ